MFSQKIWSYEGVWFKVSVTLQLKSSHYGVVGGVVASSSKDCGFDSALGPITTHNHTYSYTQVRATLMKVMITLGVAVGQNYVELN